MPDLSRRQWLAGAAGVGGLAAAADMLHEPPPPEPIVFNNDDWGPVRALFRLRGNAPLNAANLCPAFAEVLDTQQRYTEQLSGDVGFINRRDFITDDVAAARAACARMLGLADADDLALLRNTSEANAVIVNGLALGPDDEILAWDENHPTNYQSWLYRHRGCRLRRLRLPGRPQNADEIVAAFVAALTPQTRVVSFSQLSNLSGLRLPAAAICTALRRVRPDLFIHIDGAQSWGSLRVDLTAIDCDSYASSGHKWLCGPRGSGILAIRPERAARLRPLMTGYDLNFDYPEDGLPGNAQRFEQLGQRDTAALAALGSAVEMQQRIGIDRIEQRIAELTRHTLDAMADAGIDTPSATAPGMTHGVVLADLGGSLRSYAAFLALHNDGQAAAFVQGNRVHCGPAWQVDAETPLYVRLCPHIYNSEADIDAAVATLKRMQHASAGLVRETLEFLRR